MNQYNPNIHNRRSIRLKGYDYSQNGLYFITICVQYRECLFGNVINGEMVLNDAGKLVETEWLQLRERFKNIKLHEYIVMPNHFHAIMGITGKTVGDMVGAFQSIVTVKYIHGVKKMNWKPFNRKLWQRNYYDHIIRDEKSYHTITEYIINNPINWTSDKFYQLNSREEL